MAHACNSSTLGGQVDHIRSGVWYQPGQHGETLSLLKIQEISRAWWPTPVVTATWEAEAGVSLEPGRWRLQWAKITPLHSSLGDRARLCVKNKQAKKGVHSVSVLKFQAILCFVVPVRGLMFPRGKRGDLGSTCENHTTSLLPGYLGDFQALSPCHLKAETPTKSGSTPSWTQNE